MEGETITKDGLLSGIDALLKDRLTAPEPKIPDGPNAQLAQWASDQAGKVTDSLIRLEGDSVRVVDASDIAFEHAEAQLSQAILGPVERTLNPMVPGINIGTVATGGLTGLLIGELVDGLVPASGSGVMGGQGANIVAKAVAIFALTSFKQPLLSKQAAGFAGGILALQVAADVLPIDEWIQKAVSQVRSLTGGASGNVVTQANRVVRSYEAAQPPQVRGPAGHDILENVL